MEPKKWYRSKTVWFNLIVAVLSGLESQLAIFQPMVAASVWPFFTAGVTIGNLVLRSISTQAILLK